MNRQGKLVNGKVTGGIDWLKYVLPDGTERCGWTWNPVGGCSHGCVWHMPDGQRVECYAGEMAKRFGGGAYHWGFKEHYWRADYLRQPAAIKEPTSIFADSMSDLMGVQVPDREIEKVLKVCADAHWHRFFILTKNAPRLRRFAWPPNVWVGVSVPPDEMFGKPLTRQQQRAMLRTGIKVLRSLDATVRWMSIEPLSWDVADDLIDCGLDWVVIGPASKGPVIYQPDPRHLTRLVDVLDAQHIPVFFKSGLRGNPGITRWREEFPEVKHGTEEGT